MICRLSPNAHSGSNLAERRPRPYNLDLYLCLNGHSEIRNLLPSLKQKSVEAYMGLAPGRGDEIDGKESIALYRRFRKRL